MKLETVEKLTRDRDLAQRHFSFLSAELEVLNSKAELTADELLRLKEEKLRLSDCKAFLADTERKLKEAIPELSRRIRQLDNELFSLILFERYVVLKTVKQLAYELDLNLTAAYAMHTKARDAYNAANGIELYKDPRGRRKGID